MKPLASLLAVAVAAAALQSSPAHAKDAGTGPSFKGPLGLQLYSLRNQFAKDVPGTMKMVHDFGFEIVETAGTYNLTPEQFDKDLKHHHLKAVSGHFPFDRYKNDPEGVARDAKALGLKFAGCAWIPHQAEFDEKECREAIAVFNKAGEALAKHGIQFFYHCHGYEFAPFAGATYMDLIMKETDPKHVAFEIDVYWVQHPGQNPAEWIKRYPTRWQLMHVKDMKKGLKGDFTGKSDVNNDVAVGTGQMDWVAILSEAKKAGIKYYFIEDEALHSVDQIPQSLKFLETIRW